MPYTITGTVTYSSQANRDAALTRLNNALSSYSLTGIVTGAGAAGVNTPTTTTITISLQDGDDPVQARNIASAIMTALTQSNRHTSGGMSVNLI